MLEMLVCLSAHPPVDKLSRLWTRENGMLNETMGNIFEEISDFFSDFLSLSNSL